MGSSYAYANVQTNLDAWLQMSSALPMTWTC